MRLARGKQLWVAERRGRVVYTRGGSEGRPGVPKAKELKTEDLAEAWLVAERDKKLADGYALVDAASGVDAPHTTTGKVAAAKPVPARFADDVAQIRTAVRGGFHDADAVARLIEERARDHAGRVAATRAVRVRPGMTMDERARDERVDAATAARGDGFGAAAAGHLRDMLHDVAREERAAIARATPPAPDVNAAIDRAFAALTAAGIVALQAAGFTQSDGWAEIHAHATPASRGGCFYHEQDLARGVAGEGLMLGFGALGDRDARAIGDEIVAALRAEGIAVAWDGDPKQRIAIAPFVWFRRPA